MNKKIFTVNIGNYGAVVALHSNKHVQNKILVASLSEENKPQLQELFNANKSVPVYVLLDNIDQNYKKKTYPYLNKTDLGHLIKRDLDKEFPSDNPEIIKSYIATKDEAVRKWDALLVSSSDTQEIEDWMQFLLQLPNRLMGVYMLPIEAHSLSKSVLDLAIKELGVKKRSDITFFIIQNKISGTRQIVFSDQAIIFTRVVNYEFDDPKFTANFEQDIFRTNEYLKRLFPELKIQDVNIINILSEDIIKKINTIQNKELNFINYSPFQIASKFGFDDATSQNSNFSDILIACFFANEKRKILKFTTPKIKDLEKRYLVIKALSYMNLTLIIGIFWALINIFIHNDIVEEKIAEINTEKKQTEQAFESIKTMALEGDDGKKDVTLQIDEVMDFGRVDEALSKVSVDLFDKFTKLKFIRNYGASASLFDYTIINYDPKIENNSPKIKFSFSGDLSNTSGDVEDLFKKIDGLTLETKTAFSEYTVKASDLPKDIDFSKKYYTFPFNVTINSK